MAATSASNGGAGGSGDAGSGGAGGTGGVSVPGGAGGNGTESLDITRRWLRRPARPGDRFPGYSWAARAAPMAEPAAAAAPVLKRAARDSRASSS